MLEQIYNSFVFYNEKFDIITRDYYIYVVNLIKSSINSTQKLNIIIGNYYFNFNNTNKMIKIDFNFEHTLVKFGGRDSPNSLFGQIKIKNSDDFYMVRIQDYEKLKSSDIIIEYSIPNIINIKSLSEFDTYSNKLVYISPLLYPYYNEITPRSINCLTTFIDVSQPRRGLLLEKLKINNVVHKNVNNCFNKTDLYNLYKDTKILINIHQTDHHDTFEELRVLPALLSGVIVICEESPLKKYIPYNEYVIWSTYDSLIDTIKEVENNYETYYKKIFGINKYEISIENLVMKIQKDNESNILKAIIKTQTQDIEPYSYQSPNLDLKHL